MALRVAEIPKESIQKVGRNDQFYISKPRYPDEIVYRPQFGQTVKVFSNAASGAETIQIYPAIEPIAPNTVLNFTIGASADVTVIEPVEKDATTIICAPTSGALPAKSAAITDNIEQTITVATAVAVGDESVAVSALAYSVEKNRPIKFSNGVIVTTVVEAPAGATRLWVEPVVWGSEVVGTEVIPVGEFAQLEEYILVCSLNSANRTGNAQTLTDYLFCLGSDALKDITTRDRQFQLGGLHLPNDFGYERIFQQVESGLGEKKVWIISSDDRDGNQWSCRANIGQDSENKQVNTYKQLSATLEVDGPLARYRYPHMVRY